jgi:hypothetical protein
MARWATISISNLSDRCSLACSIESMKCLRGNGYWLSILLAVGIVTVNLVGEGAVQAQDAPFRFHSVFGSDGTNQPGLSPDERNVLVMDEIWDFYISARREVNKPLPKAQQRGYNQAKMNHALTVLRYGNLLDTMSQLRAFTTQNKGYADDVQRAEIARLDRALRAFNLHYSPDGGQAMVDFCNKVGPDQIRQALIPVLCNDDGTLRPIPPMELGSHQTVTRDHPRGQSQTD